MYVSHLLIFPGAVFRNLLVDPEADHDSEADSKLLGSDQSSTDLRRGHF